MLSLTVTRPAEKKKVLGLSSKINLKAYNSTFSFQCFTLELVEYPKVLNLQITVAHDSQAG